jgi:general secretion pathway protein I
MLRQRHAGFTLIEVMVALVVAALGMMAVHKMLNDYVVTAVEIERRTLASWIATNKLTELSIAPTWPALGNSDEEVEFANQQWRCEIEVSETPVTNLRRVDVSVRLLSDPERVVRKVSALIEPPAPPGFLPPQWSAPPAGDSGGRGGSSGPGSGGRDGSRGRDGRGGRDSGGSGERR